MESFLKRVLMGKGDSESHRYFVRFGKGDYKRRFLISLNKSAKIKVKTSFEFANDLVKFANENGERKFSGKILSKEKISGKEGKKKAGLFLYEVSDVNIKEFENAYYYLLDSEDSEMTLKIKKSLPKPGKNEEKIDDGFCSLILDLKYWNKLKEIFFWDLPENAKKAEIKHELIINDIILPENEKDPVKIREFALRKGKIIRKINMDSKETEKEFSIEA
ncbi:MAG: hypothetical protein Q8L29_01150 [archaeon]|nr:hypothetical protein [archaeon]